jgi:adenylylsulfate kinase
LHEAFDRAVGEQPVTRPAPGISILLTGLPSAGKTTLATAAAGWLVDYGQPAEVPDSDVLRRQLWPELGLTRDDREQNLNRLATVASLLARHGLIVLIAAIAPYAQAREAMRLLHTRSGSDFAEAHIATPLEVCRRRDVKGLYAKQARGEVIGLTGVDDVYERPESPELRLDASLETVDQSVGRLVDFILRRRGRTRILQPHWAKTTTRMGHSDGHAPPKDSHVCCACHENIHYQGVAGSYRRTEA